MNKIFFSELTTNNPIIKNHTVKGESILPGMAYMDIVYHLAIEGLKLELNNITLKNLSVLKPLIIGRDSIVRVKITFTKKTDYWAVQIEEAPKNKNLNQPEIFMTAELYAKNIEFSKQIQWNKLIHGAQNFDIDDIYSKARKLGLVHNGIMKTKGTIYNYEEGCLVEVAIEERFRKASAGYLIHPALIDGTVMASIDILSKTREDSGEKVLFLPISCETFFFTSLVSDKCYAKVDKASIRHINDIAIFDIEYYDSEGMQIGLLQGLTVKKVRDAKAAKDNPVVQYVEAIQDNVSAEGKSPLEQPLKEIMSKFIRKPAGSIDTKMGFFELGLESSQMLSLVKEIEEYSNLKLNPSLLFEYSDLNSLIVFLEKKLGQNHRVIPDKITNEAMVIEEKIEVQDDTQYQEDIHAKETSQLRQKHGFDKVAIIGLAGQYPEAKNIDEFWDNLKNGRNGITVIPESRWNWEKYFDEDKDKNGKIYTKWGGFIDDVDKFDPLFFNISPREAEVMDPQERLFLQCAYHTIEDAGYTRDTIGYDSDGNPGKVGVFAGSMWEDYKLFGVQEQALGNMVVSGGNISSIANRVSYVMNFNGPSMVVNTACSSSLTAIHLACQSLQNGECTAALAGGVNVTIHYNKYLMLSQGKFASSKGLCESFGKGGDGYVSGEGVGAVLLKPLDLAVLDGDHIYGIIKGSMLNAGGKTSGFTVPNPTSQGDVIYDAFVNAGINSRDISYIEAHGTGTSLGDPIEISGLTKAFEKQTQDKQFCKIGSVKSNIGHCEGAAGIAAVTKVLLQMKYKKLVPSLHAEELNPNIDFQETPFIVQRTLEDWNCKNKRLAGISSFGAGGANAHLVIEEYTDNFSYSTPVNQEPVLIVLSARDESRLKEKVANLKEYLTKNLFSDDKLAHIAYTLQTGREMMDERLGILVSSISELSAKLDSFLNGETNSNGIFYGQVKRNKEALSLLTADDDLIKAVDGWLKKRKYDKFLDVWTKGFNFNWNKLYNGKQMRRVSLPGYPFAKERYWIEVTGESTNHHTKGNCFKELNVLLQENTSSLLEQKFSSVFTGDEFFLKDHVINGVKMLPGVAYLEMARLAIAGAFELPDEGVAGIQLKNIVWSRPVVVMDKPVKINIGIIPEGSEDLEFEVYSRNEEGEITVHSQGAGKVEVIPNAPVINIKALKAKNWERVLSSVECYEQFAGMGLNYGPAFRGIEILYSGTSEVFVKLTMPSTTMAGSEEYALHPSMMDSAFQASFALMQGAAKISVPFALDEVQIFGKCTQSMWAHLKFNDKDGGKGNKINIDICNDSGQICVRVIGLSVRAIEKDSKNDVLLLEPEWVEEDIIAVKEGNKINEHIVVLCDADDSLVNGIKSTISGVRVIHLQSDKKNKRIEQNYLDFSLQLIDELGLIIKNKPQQPVLVQGLIAGKEEKKIFSGLSAILKTANKENSKILWQWIEVEDSLDNGEMIKILEKNSKGQLLNCLRYSQSKRYIQKLKEIKTIKKESEMPWKDGGVYLITGGAGGLGQLFAGEIVKKVKDPILILTGRSELSSEKEDWINNLNKNGARVEYRKVDISNKEQVDNLIFGLVVKYSRVDGIIHSAGVLRDNYIIKKSNKEIEEVILPKVFGLIYLNEATKKMKLDFFAYFSSMAGFFGNIGQAAYSAANAFMDQYAVYCNNEVAQKKRFGRYFSINWPLWKNGGMKIDSESEKAMMRQTGLATLSDMNGLNSFYRCAALDKDQVIVLEGDVNRLRETLLNQKTSENTVQVKSEEDSKKTANPEVQDKNDNVTLILMRLVSELLKVKMENIDVDSDLNEYGFDSVTFTEFANKLNKEYALDVSPTIFFEFPNLRVFADYLIKQYPIVFQSQAKKQETKEAAPITKDVEFNKIELKSKTRFVRNSGNFGFHNAKPDVEKIAIIGISGIFPDAQDMNEYWDNLYEGKDSIIEIPENRWDWKKIYGDPILESNKTNMKYGSFIQGVYDFDPLFFGISPKEAELMDPTQRLLMMYSWKVIEDAGYSAEKISGSNTGLFVGTGSSGYSDTINSANLNIEGYSSTGIVPSVGPNRMSFFLNIHGPSEPIETACSSALVAIHRAVSAIEDGSCDMAIVGGINTIMSSRIHISFSKAGMLSIDGRCKTFSDKANGYVRGEGVGMVLLKRLKAAEADQDHIYGVILGTAENHGGRATSLTAPNPKAQAAVIVSAYKKAGIHPRTVSYIEAHGTGTPLGDPIEINGLKMAFNEMFRAESNDPTLFNYCGLGTVKSNIGHLEMAAGIAGVIKVLLQFKHKTLVKSLHCETINPYIQLQESPFYIVQEKREWNQLKDEKGIEIPRRAGVSSFGFGGVNAHILLEEYIPTEKTSPVPVNPDKPAIFVLSAKDPERLKDQAANLLKFIEKEKLTENDLANIAYTLQTGREEMYERLGFTAGTIQELQKKLTGFIEGTPAMKDIIPGHAKKNNETVTSLAGDEEIQEIVDKWIKRNKLSNIIELWVNGQSFDWTRLYEGQKPLKISLPTYPFAKEEYLVHAVAQTLDSKQCVHSVMHPLLHENISNFKKQQFRTVFSGQEFFLTCHIVKGQKVLPGVAYLEMAREAVARAVSVQGKNIVFTQIMWMVPLVVQDSPFVVNIELKQDGNKIDFAVLSNMGNIVHCKGIAEIISRHENEALDIESLRNGVWQSVLTSADCYKRFNTMGIEYGSAHQGINELYIGQGLALAKLVMPSTVLDSLEEYTLHPSMMDSALQATIGFVKESSDSGLLVPYSLDKIEIIHKNSASMWAVATSREENNETKFDIDVCDDSGLICARVQGLVLKLLNGKSVPAEDKNLMSQKNPHALSTGINMLTPLLDVIEVSQGPVSPGNTEHVLVIGGTEQNQQDILKAYPDAHIMPVDSGDSVDNIVGKLEYIPEPGHIIWIGNYETIKGCDDEVLITGQENGVIQLFRIIKALLSLDYGTRELGWTIISRQARSVKKSVLPVPVDSSIEGLVGSMAKEYPNWNVRFIDLESGESLPMDVIFTILPDKQGNELLYSDGMWFKQRLVPVRYPEVKGAVYREGGVYIVVGGAGGIGEVWTEHLVKNYHANVIWIGRREIDSQIQGKIDRIASFGPAPWYISADSRNKNSLEKAYIEIKKKFPEIHGIVHSAIVLQDQSLINMEEGRFREGLAAKVDISVRIAQVFSGEKLDFVLFFSSMQSFTKAAGQSNYAAGCTFKDAFATRLEREWDCAVKIINWGYWGSVGIVASKEYQDRMAKTGLGSIEPEEAMKALDLLISGPLNQIALLKTTKALEIEGIAADELIEVYSEELNTSPSGQPQTKTGVPA